MLAFLVLIRDALLAMALAWVGVTFENRTEQQQNTCATQTCSDQER